MNDARRAREVILATSGESTMTTITDINDLARILREHPEWRDTIRGLVLGDEVLTLPEKLASFIEATDRNFQLVHERFDRMDERFDKMDERFDKMDERFDKMDERFDKMDERFNKMDGRLDNTVGTYYEYRAEKIVPSLVGQRLGLARPRVLVGGRLGVTGEFMDLADDALDEGRITQDEWAEIRTSDLVLSCVRRADRAQVYFVAEVSVTASDSDIERAARRATILTGMTGSDAIAGIVTTSLDDDRGESAQDQGVAALILEER